MEAKEKIREAEFWLEKIRAPFNNANQKTVIILTGKALRQWKSYLSAFLTSMRSIPDYILEDYNVKHSLGIALEDRLSPKTFEKRVKQIKDEKERRKAQKFLEFWKAKMKEITEDPACSFLIKLRHIAVHRRYVKPNTVKATLYQDKPPRVHGWFFQSYDDEDVLTICNKYFNKMKKFVKEAEQFLNEC